MDPFDNSSRKRPTKEIRADALRVPALDFLLLSADRIGQIDPVSPLF
jgi:hypothetical protein